MELIYRLLEPSAQNHVGEGQINSVICSSIGKVLLFQILKSFWFWWLLYWNANTSWRGYTNLLWDDMLLPVNILRDWYKWAREGRESWGWWERKEGTKLNCTTLPKTLFEGYLNSACNYPCWPSLDRSWWFSRTQSQVSQFRLWTMATLLLASLQSKACPSSFHG